MRISAGIDEVPTQRFGNVVVHERVGTVDLIDKSRTRGRVEVFMGAGRGKTTTALGAALRVIACGGRVIFVHFAGPLSPMLGEVRAATVFGRNWRMVGIREQTKDNAYLDQFSELVDTVRDAVAMAYTVWIYECELLILDDIGPHLNAQSIDLGQILTLIGNRPANTSIILTGQSAPEPIVQRADLCTNFVAIKEP